MQYLERFVRQQEVFVGMEQVIRKQHIADDDRLELRKTPSGTFSIYGVSENLEQSVYQETILEGGFFDEAFAVKCFHSWAKDSLESAVRNAERKAGWDPNP